MNEFNTDILPTDLVVPHPPSQYAMAWEDIKHGLKQWPIWTLMAWQDIQIRYRRSVLGPIWITLSMAIHIYTLGLLYGTLLHLNLAQYYPYLATGILSWSLISTLITEGSNVFVEAESFIKQMKMPYSTFILRTVARNFFIFFHNMLVLIPLYLFFNIKPSGLTLIALIGIFIFWVNAFVFTGLISILGTRFRDLPQLVNSLVQVVFFLTPIVWTKRNLPAQYQFIANYNPFAQYIALLREPFLNQMPSIATWITTLGITIIGMIVTFILFARARSRIVYWL